MGPLPAAHKAARVVLLVLVVVTAFGRRDAAAGVEAADAATIVNMLLDLRNPVHRRARGGDAAEYDSLAAYKGWEALYGRYSQRNSKGESFDDEHLRVYLLLGMISQLRGDAGMMESFSSDVVPLYESHETAFLRALQDLSFLIPSTCYYLKRYFGFEDKNLDKKPAFLDKHVPAMQRSLSPDQASTCLSQLK
jgi:hypothetical protein